MENISFFRKVTIGALGGLVLTPQYEVSIQIMVKSRFFPTFVIMTGVAFRAKVAFVPFVIIVFPVTTDTGQRCFLERFVNVTAFTFHIQMLAAKQ